MRPEIKEPEGGRSLDTDPRNSVKVFRSDGTIVDMQTKNNSFKSKKGELWLKNGSQWNVQAMMKFDEIRNQFDVLAQTSFD
jgi:hypothetical protein